jgi:E3 ubiquitin-protein ligase SIAH1
MDPCLKDLLKEVECPVCTEYMLPPIAMCVNGHCVCSSCREKLQTCPLCRYPFAKTRNLLAENMIRRMRFPCKYSDRGCARSFNLQRVKSHEDQCSHRPFKCPFSIVATVKCPWVGNFTTIKNHIEDLHDRPTDRRELVSGKHHGQLNCNSGEWCQAMFTMNETFFMIPRIIENKMHFCILYVGLRNKASNFKYSVLISKQDGSGNMSICATTKSYLSDVDKILKKQECVVFEEDYWQKCLDEENHLPYEVHIFRGDKQ